MMKARIKIDEQLEAAGWVAQDRKALNLWANPEHEYGVAVREFPTQKGHCRADHLLLVNRRPVGSIEAKPEGTTLTEVELQSLMYVTGPSDTPRPVRPPAVRLRINGCSHTLHKRSRPRTPVTSSLHVPSARNAC